MRPSITGFTVAEIIEHTRQNPDNWDNFVAGFEQEFLRTGDPGYAATIAAAAMRLGRPVPAHAAAWLAAGLEKKIKSGTELDTALGYRQRDGGKGTSLASRRQQQRERDVILLVMKVLTENMGMRRDPAATYTEQLLARQWGSTLTATTILDRWNRELRREAKLLPPVVVDSPDE